jgi:hypothetical protein
LGAAGAEDEARTWWHGWRAPGTHIPGVITAGTFYAAEGRVFWDVHAPEKAIAIGLHDERFVKIVVGVDDPPAEIARIQAAIAAAKSS